MIIKVEGGQLIIEPENQDEWFEIMRMAAQCHGFLDHRSRVWRI